MNNVRKQNSCRSPSIFSKCLSCQNFVLYTKSSLPLTSNSHNTLNSVIMYVVQIFSKRGRKKPTNCLFFFLWRSRGPSKDCKICRNYLWPNKTSPRITAHSYHFSEERSYVFWEQHPMLGTAMSSNKCHSLASPDLAFGMPNQDVTGYMSTQSNAGLCCDILSKTELFPELGLE